MGGTHDKDHINEGISDKFGNPIIKEISGMGSRVPGTKTHIKVFNYLLEKVKSISNIEEVTWAPGFVQGFNDENMHGRFVSHRNIVFKIRGKKKSPKIIIFAHYDHIGEGYPGANDNCTGILALLTIADIMSRKSKEKSPEYDIIFVISDGEEHNKGGAYMVHNFLPKNNIIINIDSIGNNEKKLAMSHNGNFPKYWLKKDYEYKEKYNIGLEIGNSPAGRSDLAPFLNENICIEFGYPSDDPIYHSPHDTYENLNILNMHKVIKLALEFVDDLSYGKINN